MNKHPQKEAFIKRLEAIKPKLPRNAGAIAQPYFPNYKGSKFYCIKKGLTVDMEVLEFWENLVKALPNS